MKKKSDRQQKLTQTIRKHSGPALYNKSLAHLLIICAFVFTAYSNTFSVPFQWDEGFFIEDNPIVREFAYFGDSSKAAELGKEFADRALHLKTRFVAYLTFAINYRLHGYDVFGYHLVNFSIHLLNALLVYCLVLLTFRTPLLGRTDMSHSAKMYALFAGLLFGVHPIQTEAVTYIYQRLASLVSFFYLAAMVSYGMARLAESPKKRYLFYATSLLASIFAMKTKENAFTLPFVILLYEIFFFPDTTKRRILRIIPFALTLAIIPLTILDTDKPLGEIMTDVDAATSRARVAVPRSDYLFTQFRVIVTYLRLLVYPADQVLDYYYPPSHSFFEPQVVFSFLLLSAIAGLGIWLFLKSREGKPIYRIISFGIFWFFITLAIESSIFPVNMLIDEYRVYLPSVGLFMAAATGIALISPRITPKSYMALLLMIATFLTIATFRRNTVWETKISLWSDVVKKAPLSPRAHNNLANAYLKEERIKEAAVEFQKTVRLDPAHAKAHNNLSFVYRLQGNLDQAVEHGLRAVELDADNPKPYNNLGNAYAAKGMFEKAIENYLIVIKLTPDFRDTYNNLGVAYMSKGQPDVALRHYKKALEISPDYADAHNNIGNVHMSQKNTDAAIQAYLAALKSDPRHADAHNNLGLVYALTDRLGAAEEHFKAAAEIKPDYADPHLNLGRVYLSRRDFARAEKEFITALQLNPQLTPARQFLEMLRNKRG